MHRTSSHIWAIITLETLSLPVPVHHFAQHETKHESPHSDGSNRISRNARNWDRDSARCRIPRRHLTGLPNGPTKSYQSTLQLSNRLDSRSRPSKAAFSSLFTSYIFRTGNNDDRKQSIPTMTTGALFPSTLLYHTAASVSKPTYGSTTGPCMSATNPQRSHLLALLTPSTSAPSSPLSGMRTLPRPLSRPPQITVSSMAIVRRPSTSSSM